MICLWYMNKPHKHIIQLSKKEQESLQHIIHRGKHNGRVITRARILLFSHAGEAKDAIASRLAIGRSTVQRIRDRYRERGLDYALAEAPRSGAPRKLTDAGEAHLIAIAYSDPPEGYGQWTLDLMKEQLVKEGKAPKDITTVCLWQHLNERGIKPWREKNVVRAKTHA
jgi:transposase